MLRKSILGIFLICVILGSYHFFNVPKVHFMVAENTTPQIHTYLNPFVEKLNRTFEINRILFGHKLKNKPLCDTYTIYTYNWVGDYNIPQKDEKCAILWVGSTPRFPSAKFSNYFQIWSSSPLLVNALNRNGYPSLYIPLFFKDDLPQNSSKQNIMAVIGHLPMIETLLRDENIAYHKYSNVNDIKLHDNLRKYRAIFINNPSLYQNSLDVHPLVLSAAYYHIPLVSEWIWPRETSINRFNDTINFYEDKASAQTVIQDILESKPLINQRLAKAYRLVQNEFSQSVLVQRIYNHFFDLPQQSLASDKSVNFHIATAVGHYSNGDYNLAHDLIDDLEGSIDFNLYFNNSLFVYPAKTTVLMRGFLPNEAFDESVDVVYLVYPQFKQTDTHEIVDNYAEYVQDILDKTKNTKRVLIASKSLAYELAKLRSHVYYLPQFTNPKRFYYDYDESLKSDVMFVGVNSFYRTAVPILLKHHLPVTVYGPHWPDGVAKAQYADNRILRKYYSSAKIVLNDTREGMKKFGFISNRIFDASACGTLVISDYMPEIEQIYGDSVPMWKTEEELVQLVTYYLNHPKERQEKAKRAQAITLKHFTSDRISNEFGHILNGLF